MKSKLFSTAILFSFFIFSLPVSIRSQEKITALKYGKYACTASKYRNGSYEFIPRGSFTITKAGTYTYSGFEKPSTGKFSVDKKGIYHLKVATLTEVRLRKLTVRISSLSYSPQIRITGGHVAV